MKHHTFKKKSKVNCSHLPVKNTGISKLSGSSCTSSLHLSSVMKSPNEFSDPGEFNQLKLQTEEETKLSSSFELLNKSQAESLKSSDFTAEPYITWTENAPARKEKASSFENMELNQSFEDYYKQAGNKYHVEGNSCKELSTADPDEFLEKSSQDGKEISKEPIIENNPKEIFQNIVAQIIPLNAQSDLAEQPINTVHCKNCKAKKVGIELDCFHKYCIDCAIDIVIQASNGKLLLSEQEIKRLILRCPKCKILLRKDNYWKIINPIYNSLVSEIDPNEWKKCKRCKSIKNKSDSYYNFCKECFASILRAGNTKKFDDRVQRFMGEIMYCNGCENELNFVRDCLTSVCPLRHHYCKNCLLEIKEKGFCLKCEAELSKKTQKRIKRIFIQRCAMCREKVDSEILISKNCCVSNVCADCQISFSDNYCVSCKKELTESS